MRSGFFKCVIFSLVFLLSAGNALAKDEGSSIGEAVARVLLFLPGALLEEYFAEMFDDKGSVDYSEEMVFIPYIKTSGLHPDYQRYIIQTFAKYVKDVGRYKLRAADKAHPYTKSTSMPVILNIAQRKGCPFALFITVKENGSGMLFSFAMKDTQTEELIWHDEYKALIPEDVAPILFRVANSMGTGKTGSNPKSFYDAEYPIYIKESNFQPTAATHETTSSEYQNLPSNFEKKDDIDSVGRNVRIAFSFGVDLWFKGPKAGDNISLGAWYDFKYFMVGTDLNFQGHIARDTTITSMGLNLAVPIFARGNNAPFVIGEVGFSNATFPGKNYKGEDHDETVTGALLALGAGYQFNRYSPFTVRFDLKYFKNTGRIHGHTIQGLGFETVIGY